MRQGMTMGLRSKLALGAAAALMAATPAAAQDAIVDPDSPSGSEYNVPLDRARDEASGSGSGRGGGGIGVAGASDRSGGGPSAGGGAPGSGTAAASGGGGSASSAGGDLFGDGIKPARSGSGKKESKSDAKKRSAGRPASADAIGGAVPLSQAAARGSEKAASGGSAPLLLLALALAVLFGGGAVGVAIRQAQQKRGAS